MYCQVIICLIMREENATFANCHHKWCDVKNLVKYLLDWFLRNQGMFCLHRITTQQTMFESCIRETSAAKSNVVMELLERRTLALAVGRVESSVPRAPHSGRLSGITATVHLGPWSTHVDLSYGR